MLKISTRSEDQSTRLELEGRLTGPWVGELDRCWQLLVADPRGKVIVDLSGVTFVNSDAKRLLSRMWQEGAQLHAAGCLTTCIVDDITHGGRSGCSHSHSNNQTEKR